MLSDPTKSQRLKHYMVNKQKVLIVLQRNQEKN
jgi:hypothetical protein